MIVGFFLGILSDNIFILFNLTVSLVVILILFFFGFLTGLRIFLDILILISSSVSFGFFNGVKMSAERELKFPTQTLYML